VFKRPSKAKKTLPRAPFFLLLGSAVKVEVQDLRCGRFYLFAFLEEGYHEGYGRVVLPVSAAVESVRLQMLVSLEELSTHP